MRTSWLLTSTLLAAITIGPAHAAPIHDLAPRFQASVIAPIEIKELVIRAQVADVAAPLQELLGNQPEQQGNLEIYLVVDIVLTTLMQADRACEVDEKSLEGTCVAETILGPLSRSEMVQKVIVRGWDYKGKKSVARLKQLAADPTMAGAREVLLAVLNGLLIEGREQATDESALQLIEAAHRATQGWPAKWSLSELDASKSE